MGWFATALGAFAVLGAPACASGPRAEPVSTTSTTSAATTGEEQHGSVELYVARQASTATGACGAPSPNIQFPAQSAELRATEAPHIDRWATCLNKQELQHVNVVLIGGDDPNGQEGLFAMRAQQIKNALVARGVDPGRIVIAAPSPLGAVGPWAATPGVHIEVTHLDEVRTFGAPAPSAARAFR